MTEQQLWVRCILLYRDRLFSKDLYRRFWKHRRALLLKKEVCGEEKSGRASWRRGRYSNCLFLANTKAWMPGSVPMLGLQGQPLHCGPGFRELSTRCTGREREGAADSVAGDLGGLRPREGER